MVDKKWKYRMPKEGGITWMDAIAMPTGAENIEQAYAFINAMYEPKLAGLSDCSRCAKLPIPVHPATYSGDIRPLIPAYPAT